MSKSALKILNTAEKLFNQSSFNSVGVDLIRDESGCSKTTMYTYYKNKNQLVCAVLTARDIKFRQSLLHYIGSLEGKPAIYKIFDWHIEWFQQDCFKGCLFVRAVAESNGCEDDIVFVAQEHKHWVKQLISSHCIVAHQNDKSELIYTLIEGLISRFLVDGYDESIANILKQQMINILDAC